MRTNYLQLQRPWLLVGTNVTAGSHQGCMAVEVGKGFGLRVPWCTTGGVSCE